MTDRTTTVRVSLKTVDRTKLQRNKIHRKIVENVAADTLLILFCFLLSDFSFLLFISASASIARFC